MFSVALLHSFTSSNICFKTAHFGDGSNNSSDGSLPPTGDFSVLIASPLDAAFDWSLLGDFKSFILHRKSELVEPDIFVTVELQCYFYNNYITSGKPNLVILIWNLTLVILTFHRKHDSVIWQIEDQQHLRISILGSSRMLSVNQPCSLWYNKPSVT